MIKLKLIVDFIVSGNTNFHLLFSTNGKLKLMRINFILLMLLIVLTTNAQQSNKMLLKLEKKISTQRQGWTFDIMRKFDLNKQLIFDSSRYHEVHTCVYGVQIDKNDSVSDDIFIPVLLGQGIDSLIYLTFDTNLNNSFLDDSSIILDSAFYASCNSEKNKLVIKIVLPLTVNPNRDSLFLNIVPPCFLPMFKITKQSAFINNKFIGISSPLTRTAILTVAGETYSLSIRNSDTRLNFHKRRNVKIEITKNGEDNYAKETEYQLLDTFKIGSSFYSVNYLSANGDSIILEKINSNNTRGNKTGFLAYNFKEKEIFSSSIISLNSYRNKYILMEFWGTWCAPCVALHDTLISFLKENMKINYLGIAYDVSVDKVKNYVSINKQLNKQIFVNINMSQQESIVDKYNINSFPTFILIDKKQNIIYRGVGQEGFYDLIAWVKKNKL